MGGLLYLLYFLTVGWVIALLGWIVTALLGAGTSGPQLSKNADDTGMSDPASYK